mmetsp:Transcript_45326/g.176096  ORF Transcript_45326/g.176096 Transcript_45326/m.176096 type:complete len:84 (-) Transcript_45326:2857-3108(-)
MSIPPGLKNGLLVLEKTVCKFITVAREYASIAIVTNSQPGWVEDSSSQFMPQVKALLLSLKVKVTKPVSNSASGWMRTSSSSG